MELRVGQAPNGQTRIAAGKDARVIALVAAERRDTPLGPTAAMGLDVHLPALLGRADAAELVAAVTAVARDEGCSRAVLRVSDPLVRYEARRHGFTGALRGDLTRDVPAVDGESPARAEDGIEAEIAALLPDTEVVRRRNLLRAPDLAVSVGGQTRLRVQLPRDFELMPEAVACAIDVALAIKTRFGRAALGIARLAFGGREPRMERREIDGYAQEAPGALTLAPPFVAVDLLDADRQDLARRGKSRRAVLSTDVPFARLEEVVAHECWHLLDTEIQLSGRVYTTFHARLGDALGVETLEQALRGCERGAPERWRSAHERLVAEVSAYAATNAREATAEMFTRWWCARAPQDGVVGRFGELMEELFPA